MPPPPEEVYTAAQASAAFGYKYIGDGDARVHPNVIRVMVRTPVMQQRSPEWFAARRRVLSASDAAAAVGENPFESPWNLVMKKADLDPNPFAGNAACDFGAANEDMALEILLGKLKAANPGEPLAIFDFGLVAHPVHAFLAGSPDGVVSTGEMVEIKCPYNKKFNATSIPIYYYAQVQLCLQIFDSPRCHFTQYRPECHPKFPNDPEHGVLVVSRDEEWWGKSLPAMREFWQQVVFYRAYPEQYTIVCAERSKGIEVAYTIGDPDTCMIDPTLYEPGGTRAGQASAARAL